MWRSRPGFGPSRGIRWTRSVWRAPFSTSPTTSTFSHPRGSTALAGTRGRLPSKSNFYAIYPLLLMALLSAHRRLAPVLIGLCGLALCLRIGVALAAPTIAPDYTGMATECRIDGILAGAIAALLGRSDAS